MPIELNTLAKSDSRPPLHPADDSLNCLPKNKLDKLKKSRAGTSIFRGCGSMTASTDPDTNPMHTSVSGEYIDNQNNRSENI